MAKIVLGKCDSTVRPSAVSILTAIVPPTVTQPRRSSNLNAQHSNQTREFFQVAISSILGTTIDNVIDSKYTNDQSAPASNHQSQSAVNYNSRHDLTDDLTQCTRVCRYHEMQNQIYCTERMTVGQSMAPWTHYKNRGWSSWPRVWELH